MVGVGGVPTAIASTTPLRSRHQFLGALVEVRDQSVVPEQLHPSSKVLDRLHVPGALHVP